MNRKVLITASKGQLGKEIANLVSDFDILDFTFIDRTKMDLCDTESIRNYFKSNRFDVIINTAAYTGVDKAEEDVGTAKSVNSVALKELAKIAKDQQIQLIHISTDYVFNGKSYRPYIETDSTDPLGIYGQSKLEGELEMLKINPPRSAIIRTSWLYSSFGNNFVKTMLRLSEEHSELRIVSDQVGTPTYAKDLAYVILNTICNDKFNSSNCELYHYSNEGVCSWYDFAKAIFEIKHINCNVVPIETKDYPTPAKRPFYSVLNKEKIKSKLDINIPYWRDSLKECLKKMA